MKTNLFTKSIVTTITIAIFICFSCRKTPIDPPPVVNDSTPGQAMFWVASDLGCGDITVICNGVTAQITGYSQTTPSCGATNTATFTLAPGTYNYSASCSNLTWSGTITVSANECSNIQLKGNGGSSGGGGNTTGQVMFWTSSDLGGGNITVICNGLTSQITGYYSTGVPSCGASAAATFTLAPGTYNYSASCSSLTWSGTVTISANKCSTIQLTSNGGGGGGGGGFLANNTATFWIASDFGCGNITVNCGGKSSTITSYFSSGAPGCGAAGTATFVLPTTGSTGGIYNYTASCSGLTWSGTVTTSVFSNTNGCIEIQLTH
ncbi:MAG TPA: hypothetical protein VIJ75_08010 [Hanamia sp.]